MDFVYIPEVFTYGYLRNPQYRDYEQPWNQDYFKCSSSSSSNKKSVESQRSMQQQQQYKKGCDLCKESKRRNLEVYIKSRSNSCHGIYEEEEEIDAMHSEKSNASVNQEKRVISPRNTNGNRKFSQ